MFKPTNSDAEAGTRPEPEPEPEPSLSIPNETEKPPQNNAESTSQVVKAAEPMSELETLPGNVQEYVTGFKLALIVGSMAMACFLTLLTVALYFDLQAIPNITDQFHSLSDVGWYASAYQFGSAAPQPLTGKIYTHFNSKWTFVAFFGIFELGSVVCGAAVSSTMLIIGRAVSGLGAAGILNGTQHNFQLPLLGLTMGTGPLIGGAFTSYSTWRWCFYVNLPLGAITVAAILILHIPQNTPKQRALKILPKLYHYLDLLGFALFAPAVLQLILAIQFGGNQFAWGSSQVIGLFCGSAATFVVWFLWNSYKGDDALLPVSMIRRRTVWTGGLYQAILLSVVYGATFFLPIYFQSILNANAILSGVYLLPTILPQLLLAGASGPLLMKIGYVIPLAIISTILLTIANGLYSLLHRGTSAGEWIGFQIIAGSGSGIGFQMAIMALQGAVTEKELPSAMSFIIFSQSLGPSIFLTLCNVVFDSSLRLQIPQHAPHLNSTAILEAGATGFRTLVAPSDLPDLLVAYANSIDHVFYLVAGTAGLGGVVLWGMGWKDLRKKHKDKGEQEDTSNDGEAVAQ